jgi:hypothetical protein
MTKRPPGIKGTLKELNRQVQRLMATEVEPAESWYPRYRFHPASSETAAKLIEFKVREAHRMWDTP